MEAEYPQINPLLLCPRRRKREEDEGGLELLLSMDLDEEETRPEQQAPPRVPVRLPPSRASCLLGFLGEFLAGWSSWRDGYGKGRAILVAEFLAVGWVGQIEDSRLGSGGGWALSGFFAWGVSDAFLDGKGTAMVRWFLGIGALC